MKHALLILIVLFAFGCKTRKVSKESTEQEFKQDLKEVSTLVKSSDSSSIETRASFANMIFSQVDSTSEITEAESASYNTKTGVWNFKGNVKHKKNGTSKKNKNTTKADTSSKAKDFSSKSDSTGKKKAKQEGKSNTNNKNTQSEGVDYTIVWLIAAGLIILIAAQYKIKVK